MKIHQYDDGGAETDGWPDAQAIPDGFRRDIRPDFAPVGPDLSYDACIAQPEICNTVDDNCNGQVDEGYDTFDDPLYCNACKGCLFLLQHNAYPDCENGVCAILACFEGYMDKDKQVANGCEYFCINTGPEICDGIDNNCNGQVDEGLSMPQGICKNMGECAGAQAACKGEDGWQCSYSAGVELKACSSDADCGSGFSCDLARSLCPNVVAIDEKLCDGKDGDCDGKTDDPWTNPALATALGNLCDPEKACSGDGDCGGGGSTCVNNFCTPKLGVCRDEGQYICDPATHTKTVCMLKKPGGSPATEVCNGIDDNCDGLVDNAVVDEAWITVTSGGTFKIFKYEASRPDSTASSAGILSTGRPCSVAGRLPWSQVTKAEAQAACKRVGGNLCTTIQWETACMGSSGTTFPYGGTFNPDICNGRAYDTDSAAAGNQDDALPTNEPASCVSNWGNSVILNMSGNVKEWTATSFSSGNPTGYEIKGGAYDTPSINGFGAGLSCTYDLPAPAATLQLPTLGFRCCK